MGIAESPERKRPMRLPLFTGGLGEWAQARGRSPRSFDAGAVGLGIVAAMSEPTWTEPIAIVAAAARRSAARKEEEEEETWELSESYTCVISRDGIGGNAVTKRVYYDNGSGKAGGCYTESVGVFAEEPPPPPAAVVRTVVPAAAEDFLSRCYLCGKSLQGLDIFMYRGDKAFCSAECRCHQIVCDELRENWRSEALKPREYSVSPCSAPLLFSAGLAAA